MKLIENMVCIKVNDDENRSLIINTLNGNINVISEEEAIWVQKWKEKNDILPLTVEEEKFVKELTENEYIVENSEYEKIIEEKIFDTARERHKAIRERLSGAVFVVTYKCNFRCPYCYENAINCKDREILTKDMVDKIFELHNNKLEKIAFYGGEPLLPDTKGIIQYIISKAPYASYSVTTNGYYLSEFFDIFSKIYVDNIMVTLDGPENIHNVTRILKDGSGTYQKIVDGIKKFLENSIPIKIRMNISKKNIEECLKLRETFINEFKEQYSKGILMFELQPIFQINPKEKSDLNEKIFFEKSTSHGNKYKYNMMAHTVSPILNKFINNSKKSFRPRYCNCDAEGKRMFYDTKGDIYSCILSLKNNVASIGKYYPEYYLKENSIYTRNIETIEECRNCKMKFLCGGGCANAIIDEKGEVMKPNCVAILNEVNHELPKLFRKYTQAK